MRHGPPVGGPWLHTVAESRETFRETALGGLVVQRRTNLRRLRRLARLVRARIAVGLDRTTEVEAEIREARAVASVGTDLLERSEQLLLGLGPAIGRQRDLLGRLDLDGAVLLEARRRRDQLPDDHVLLQAEQLVDLALDRRVREHLGGLLERGGRQERLGREGRLRDPEDQRLPGRLLGLLL